MPLTSHTCHKRIQQMVYHFSYLEYLKGYIPKFTIFRSLDWCFPRSRFATIGFPSINLCVPFVLLGYFNIKINPIILFLVSFGALINNPAGNYTFSLMLSSLVIYSLVFLLK
jgi:hypothetical protein